MQHPQKQSGFALLMSLLVVGVVVSVGLSILDLSIKQVRLSSNAKESELAFHAANAGMECARYWRRNQSNSIERGLNISPICFGESASNYSRTIVSSNANAAVYRYQYEFTWGSGTQRRCTSINTVVASTSPNGAGVTIAIGGLVAGYPGGATATKVCEAGSRCSTVSVQGYNLPCSNIGGFGIVQREVLLEF